MDYEALLAESDTAGLVVKEKPLRYNDGRINGNKIAIRRDIETSTEKACVLAEELGHYHTSVGRILDQSDSWSNKMELHARYWAHNHLIGLIGIVKCFKAGCQTLSEMADTLDVTEEFLQEALERYRQKYGVYTILDNYIIYFEPYLAVVEMLSSGTD